MADDAGRDMIDVSAPQGADDARRQTEDAAAPAAPAATSAPTAAAPAAGPLSEAELARLTDEIVAAFKTVYDPEIPVDIYELGLIYKVDVSDERLVTVDMTLTAPGCPVAGEMPGWVERAVRGVAGVNDVVVNMVFEPPWDLSRMSEEARLQLNLL